MARTKAASSTPGEKKIKKSEETSLSLRLWVEHATEAELISYLNHLTEITEEEIRKGQAPQLSYRVIYHDWYVQYLIDKLKSEGRALPVGMLKKFPNSSIQGYPWEVVPVAVPPPPAQSQPFSTGIPWTGASTPNPNPTPFPSQPNNLPPLPPLPNAPPNARMATSPAWAHLISELDRLASEFCTIHFLDPRFYGFPRDIRTFGTNGSSIKALLLGSSTHFAEGWWFDIKCLVNGAMVGSDSPLLIRDPATNRPLVQVKKSHPNLINGEERWIRALRYEDGLVIRYFMHQRTSGDITTHGFCFKTENGQLVPIERAEYNHICQSRGYLRA